MHTQLGLALAVFVALTTPALGQTPAAPAAGAPQQTPAAAPALLRVFLDCDQCDHDYLRQNVLFVDYVRDRAVADLHVLVTVQGTGGGGQSWVLNFLGIGRLQGQDRTLSFSTPQTATDDERRKEFARVFRIGLVAYAADTPALAQLDVTFKKSTEPVQTSPAHDPWHYWVFRVNTNGNMNGEQSTTSKSYRANFSANRTTDEWKFNINGNGSLSEDNYEVPEDDIKFQSKTHSWNFNALIVNSLGPKWSVGGRAAAGHSSFSNNRRSLTVAPAIEYDFFPYSVSAERKLTIQYSFAVTNYQYRDLTIFDKLHETVPSQQIQGVIALRQRWGSLQVQSTFSQHLNAPEHYRAVVFGEADVRLFKGFSFNVFGDYERIRDQISLQKGASSTAEVLLHLRQLATGYSYFFSFGVSYSFGSIYNSIVNTRFTGVD